MTSIHRALVFALVCMCGSSPAYAQARGAGAGRGGPPPTAMAIAPIELTGYWTAVLTEDWHVRALTPARGDFGSGVAGTIENPGVGFVGAGPNPSAQGNIPYKAAAAQEAMKWDAAKDEADGNACKAYGAAGIMRQPTHLHITWQDENTLKVEADYGTQTRLFHFGPPADGGRLDYSNATLFPPQPAKVEPPAGVAPSRQSSSRRGPQSSHAPDATIASSASAATGARRARSAASAYGWAATTASASSAPTERM